MTRPWGRVCAFLGFWFLVSWLASPCSGSPGDELGHAQLRRAWVLHRLEAKPQEARPLYVELYENEAQLPDLRSRAALGIGLLARDAGRDHEAVQWFERAARVEGASSRWLVAALDLLAAGRRRLEVDPTRPLRDLELQVAELEQNAELLSRIVEERDDELVRQRDIIRRLQQAYPKQQPIDSEERKRREAQLQLDSWLEQERDLAKVRRHSKKRRLRAALDEAQEHLRAGRTVFAFDEAKRALGIDPLNREAQDLIRTCQGLLAGATGRRSLPAAGDSRAQTTNPETQRALIVAVMSSYLEEGKRCYRSGQISQAIDYFERVLEEYGNSPLPLGEEHVSVIVQPAERLLNRCFEDSGLGPEARRLHARRADLLSALDESSLLIREQEAELEKLWGDNPEHRTARARQAVDEQMLAGIRALDMGAQREARLAFGDVLLLLDWFPSLDPDQKIRDRVSALTP